MSLLSADGLIEFATCDNGRFAISDLADGPYVVAPAPPEAPCTTRNCGGGRFFEALTAGAATVVTFGDSVPKVGDAPMFPARLAQLLAPIATIDNRNVAVPGTVSSEWLPGSNLFTGTLAPHIPAGDLFVISLGGNDIMASLQDPSLLADIPGAIQATKELVVEIVARVQAIVDAIREVNPDADIVYCLYPNYGQATETMPWSLAGQFLGPETMIEILETARGAVPTLDGFLLADMYGAFEGVKLDDYLYDPLHFNALGQTRYAEHLFATLGGVLVGPTPRAPHGITPLGLETRFGFSEAPY